MSSVLASRIAVCPEYQHLLHSCQKALAAWQQRQTVTQRDSFSERNAREMQQLQREYAGSYAQLESHERSCQTCQYISKVGGLDFESMSNALNHHYPNFT
jgi:hypothetical protein